MQMELGAGLARARPLGMGVVQRHFLASYSKANLAGERKHRRGGGHIEPFAGPSDDRHQMPGELQVVGVASHQKLLSARAHLATDARLRLRKVRRGATVHAMRAESNSSQPAAPDR